jgi:hypothetical protein
MAIIAKVEYTDTFAGEANNRGWTQGDMIARYFACTVMFITFEEE